MARVRLGIGVAVLDEHVGAMAAFVPELGALGHAEAVLFVDDDEAEVGEPHGVF